MTFPTDNLQAAELFTATQDGMAKSCSVAMDQLLKSIEVLWGHRCHAVIVAIPMTSDMQAVGMLAMDSFAGNPTGILDVAQYLAMSAQGMFERQTTGGVH